MKDVSDDILKAVFSQMGDSYEYIKFLGKGATSRVYLVYQKHLKQHRALKIMNYEYVYLLMEKEYDTDSTVELNERRKRFINEAKAVFKKLAKKLHPDVGGSNEDFKLLNQVYNHFLEHGLYFSNESKFDLELEKVSENE